MRAEDTMHLRQARIQPARHCATLSRRTALKPRRHAAQSIEVIMASLFDPQVRTAILDRISHLTPERKPVWGRFTAPEMVCHVSCDLRQALGELDAGPPSGRFSRFPLNWLVIHVVPWPKGKGQSPPEFLATRPTTWTADVNRLRGLVERFSARGAAAADASAKRR